MKGMGVTLEQKYGDSTKKIKGEWKSIGSLAAKLIATAKAGAK